MFKSSPAELISRAVTPAVHPRTESGTVETMTRSQLQALKQRDDREGDKVERVECWNDKRNECERAKELASHWRHQVAYTSIHGQNMKQVTSGGPRNLHYPAASTEPPSKYHTSNMRSDGMHFAGVIGQPAKAIGHQNRADIGDDDRDDEDVPLGILQARRFANSSRPPIQLGEVDLYNKGSSGATCVMGGSRQSCLPVVACQLPRDPYFGARLVNPSTRALLAKDHSAGSVPGFAARPQQLMVLSMPAAPGTRRPDSLIRVNPGGGDERTVNKCTLNRVAMMDGAINSSGMPPTPSTPQMNKTIANGVAIPQAPQVPQMFQDASAAQIQQLMQTQIWLMQRMLDVQRAQLVEQMMLSARRARLQHQPDLYLRASYSNTNRPMSIARQDSHTTSPNMELEPILSGRDGTVGLRLPRPSRRISTMSSHDARSVNGLLASFSDPVSLGTSESIDSRKQSDDKPSRSRPMTPKGERPRLRGGEIPLTPSIYTKQQISPNVQSAPRIGNADQSSFSIIRKAPKAQLILNVQRLDRDNGRDED